MVTNEFAEASAELIEILNYFPKSEVEKIPLKLRIFFKRVANPNYCAKIDPYKPLNQQNIKEKTKDLIAVLYRNYWCNKEEKDLLDAQLSENDKKYEEKIKEQYKSNNIFNNSPKNIENTFVEKYTELIEYKESKWYSTIILKIKKILNLFT